VKEVVYELQPKFERRTNHRLLIQWGGTPSIARSVENCERFDLVVIPAGVIEALKRRALFSLARSGRAFSARSHPAWGASMPVSWERLGELESGSQRTIAIAREYLWFQK
jgi:hypothetical protein